MLTKSMQEFPIKKVITFHNTVKNAKGFINGFNEQDLGLRDIISHLTIDYNYESWRLDHINGTMSAGERNKRLDFLKKVNMVLFLMQDALQKE